VADLGGSLIVCPANNMHGRKTAEALKDVHNSVRAERCRETGLWLVSADVTGERDGYVSWGPTAVLNPVGEVVAQLPLEKTGLLVFDILWPHLSQRATCPPSAAVRQFSIADITLDATG
jgi:predicted amidohydrolase